MNLEGAVRLGQRRELEAIDDPDERGARTDEMVERMYEHGGAINMASHLEIDDVIDPADTHLDRPRARRRSAAMPSSQGESALPSTPGEHPSRARALQPVGHLRLGRGLEPEEVLDGNRSARVRTPSAAVGPASPCGPRWARRRGPSTNDSTRYCTNGISCVTPSEPWICSAGRHVVEHLHHRLHRGDVGPHTLVVVVLVDLPRRLHREQPERLDLHPRVGDHLLHHLLVEDLTLGAATPRARRACRRCGATSRPFASRGGCDRRRGGSARRQARATPRPSMWSAGTRTSS